ncbi:MAG: class I SAM-dependent methyltransferase [Actinoallomurus sp.]
MSIRDQDEVRPAKLGKERFDDIYDQPDPRAYFGRLGPLDYQIPHHGQRVFRGLAKTRRAASNAPGPVTTVDLCCSYGINAALLNHRLTYGELTDRYVSPKLAQMPSGELATRDRGFFADRRRPEAARVIGVDTARNAIGYGVRAGLLSDGFAENLETTAPSAELRSAVADADLITVTGGVGYITERTMRHLLDNISATPWVAAFVLRTIPYRKIAETLSQFGLVTEKLPDRTFPQRRFSGAAEERFALDELERLGMDSAGRESHGYYHTELFVSRPAQDAAEVPIEKLLEFSAD